MNQYAPPNYPDPVIDDYEPGLNPWWIRLPILAITGAVLFGIILVVAVTGFQIVYGARIVPNVWVGSLNVGGMTTLEAETAVSETVRYADDTVFTFRDGDRLWQATARELGVNVDTEQTVAAAFAVGHGQGLFDNIVDQVLAWLNGASIPPVITFDQSAAAAFVARMSAEVNMPASDATLVINGTDIQAQAGSAGRTLDVGNTLARLNSAISSMQNGGEIPLSVIEHVPRTLDSALAADKARIALSSPIMLVADDGRGGSLGPWLIPVDQIQALLRVETVTLPDGALSYDVTVDPSVYRSSLEALAQGLIVPAQNGRFTFDETTGQLQNIQAAVDGRRLNVEQTLARISEAVFNPTERVVPLAFDYELAQYHNGVTAAELGITELISEGVSFYTGSTEARRTNISVSIARFNGLIIPPGAIFSFNEHVGDISPEEGFVDGFVIVGNQTVRGVGGGVCQVSTTAFRAAFYGGFPIVERYAHGYRVGYYEIGDPEGVGMDAAIYTPELDFRFLNDTDYHLLIEAFIDPTTNSAHFRLYSTNPGRRVVKGQAEVVDTQPPAETRFVANADLAPGQQLQVDWPAEGSYVRVPRIITDLNGNEISREFIASQYQPWGAVVQVAPGDPRLAGGT
ncbi:MAG: VanW family protein [Pleurocapsa minor GSE-CHR-MK-17-07R]|nr:VanW family protein [Pleurocapsa minor GSE-CHR-MK 17-07R]